VTREVWAAVVCAAVLAGAGAPRAAQDAPRKQAHAQRVRAGEIRLDGRLDEAAWDRAVPITDFRMAEPTEGAEPTDPMEVRFLYDGSALYVGARLSTGQGGLRTAMGRRDDAGQSENLQIELDTYLDRRTAYMFGVTASGVRLDHYHRSDEENSWDSGFDPVWEARSQVGDGGWTAELWLPFNQLRFNARDAQVWGLNIRRFRPTLNEEDYWIVIGRTERGWSSRFGDLDGISGIQPSRRLELLPYVAGSSLVTGATRDRANPFDNGVNLTERVGTDLKMGIGPNLTLEATVNPDFGQIEADPAEVNLSAFETFFSEKRPFFIEGSNLLQFATNNFYYSRRIGARPSGPAAGDYVDYPAAATILGAAKLTGRLSSGTSLGFLGAVTDEEFAAVDTAGLRSSVRVAPRTFWGVARVQKEFGPEGSTVGLHATTVRRGYADDDPLADLFTRRAYTIGADTDLLFGHRTYEVELSMGTTDIAGTPSAMSRVQRSNGHLFQRPDSGKVRYDPARTGMAGSQTRWSVSKNAGRHWLWSVNQMIESPEFEPNDFGRLNYAGDFTLNSRLTWRQTQPGRYLRNYSFQFSNNNSWYFDTGLGVKKSFNVNANAGFNNFWGAGLGMGVTLRANDAQLTRGGPAMGTPQSWGMGASLHDNNASNTRWSAGVNYSESENGDRSVEPNASLSLRPSPSWQISFDPRYNHEVVARQYVTALDGGRVETYGERYIFGAIDRTTVTLQFRANYTFKPDLTLDVYAEPFAASGRYDGFGELLAPRSRDLRPYGTPEIPLTGHGDGSYTAVDGLANVDFTAADFNVKSFRSNVVLRWEWRPGSLLYVVWQQNRQSNERLGDHVGVGDAFASLAAPGQNVFAVKTTWWISR
jgi:Domain of unknown function (DUF5916)